MNYLLAFVVVYVLLDAALSLAAFIAGRFAKPAATRRSFYPARDGVDDWQPCAGRNDQGDSQSPDQ